MTGGAHEKVCCRDVGERLLRFRDGDLPADETEWLREHLHLCTNCMNLLSSYEEMLVVLERLRPVALPEGLLERLRRGLSDPDGGCCR